MLMVYSELSGNHRDGDMLSSLSYALDLFGSPFCQFVQIFIQKGHVLMETEKKMGRVKVGIQLIIAPDMRVAAGGPLAPPCSGANVVRTTIGYG
jgi:hypothetical protein